MNSVELSKLIDEITFIYVDDPFEQDPINEETRKSALKFVKQLPVWVPAPYVGYDPDGSISLEWILDDNAWRVSVSFDKGNELIWAAVGKNPSFSICGKAKF